MAMSKKLILAFIMFAWPITLNAGEYKFEYHKDIEVTANAELMISNTSGAVEIKGAPVDRIVIDAVKSVKATDAAEAEEVARHIDIKVKKSGNRVSIITSYIKMDDRSRSFFERLFGAGGDSFGSVDYEIKVPMDCTIEIDNLSGEILVSEVNKPVYVSATSSDMHLHTIRGSIEIEGISGNIKIAEIEGDVDINATSSDIKIDSITGKIDIHATSGSATGRNIWGAISLAQTSGDVYLERLIGEIRVKSISGSIYLEQDSGSIDIVTQSGNIEIKTQPYNECKYYAESNSGRIYFAVPATSSGNLNIETISGDISTEMPITIRSKTRNRLLGGFGESGPGINLKTSSGDITFGQY
jgi:hypothetical protein